LTTKGAERRRLAGDPELRLRSEDQRADRPGAGGCARRGTLHGDVPQAEQFFLKIDDFDGGSTDDKHKGEFDIGSYNFSIGTDAVGQVVFSPLTVVLASGLGSALVQYAATQQPIDALRLVGRTAGEGAQEVYELRLNGVTIAQVDDSDTDLLRFDFERLALTTRTQNPDGSLGAAFTFSMGTPNADVMVGGTGSDWLAGGGGDDTLTAGLGDDRLTGGAGADTIVYRTGDGTDTVTDFNPAEGDLLDLRGVIGVHSLADLQVTQNGPNTVITLGSGLVLENFASEGLAPGQFLFSPAPPDIDLSNASIAENSAAGAVVGLLTASGLAPGETVTFSLLDDADGRFAIDGTNLVVAGALDFETAPSQTVTVQFTRFGGTVYSEAFTVAVTDVTNQGISPEPVDFFLKIDGVLGDSADAKHKGEFEIDRYGFTVSTDASGQTVISPLTVSLASGLGSVLAAVCSHGT
jgi:type VI protein secretion system component Hcp